MLDQHRLSIRAALCLGFLLSTIAPVRAQSEAIIQVQLVADADGSVLAHGTATLKTATTGSQTQTAADADGRVVFRRVSPGEYVLSGSMPGFSTREVRVLVEPREIRTVMIRLVLNRVGVEVRVTGNVETLSSTHSPSSTVLTAPRVEGLPLSQRWSLTDAIVTTAPGMIRGHDDFVHVRGHEVALNPLINGVGFWENAHAVFSSGLSPDIIETANVMTGGFPAEYGNRFGGVVDVVTKSGFTMQNRGTASVAGGQAGRWNAAGQIGGHRDRTGYYLSGSLFASDRYLSPPDPAAIHDHGQGGHLFGQVDRSLGNAGSLKAVLMGDASDFEIPKTPLDLEVRPWANADERTSQQTAILGWTRAWSNLSVNASFYERWSRVRLLPASGPMTAQADVTRELWTIGTRVDVTRLAGRHAIKAGVDAVRLKPQEGLSYDYSGYRNFAHLVGLPHIHITDNTITFSGQDAGGQVSVYAQDKMQLGDRLTADLGVRLDHYDLLVSRTHASPRVNVAVLLGGGALLHASYNHFFVGPPVEGILSSGAGLTERIREIGVPLPPVQPTSEDQFELGTSMPTGSLRLALTGYYRATDNPVHTTVWPDARIYSYASFDRGRAYGLEAKAEAPGLARYGVTGYLNYALGRVYFFNPVTGGFVTESEHIAEANRFLAPMDQTHTLTAGVTYRHARSGLWAGTIIEYGSGTPMEHEHAEDDHEPGEEPHEHPESSGDAAARVPAHTTASVSIGMDLLRRASHPKLTLQLDVENITDNVYLIAQEGEFTPGQFSIPRLVALTARVRW
jgi:outer membrane receptor for ferrienterochelin and colicins